MVFCVVYWGRGALRYESMQPAALLIDNVTSRKRNAVSLVGIKSRNSFVETKILG